MLINDREKIREDRILAEFVRPFTVQSMRLKLEQSDPPFLINEQTLRRVFRSLEDKNLITKTGTVINRQIEYAPFNVVGAMMPKIFNPNTNSYVPLDVIIETYVSNAETGNLSNVQRAVQDFGLVLAELLHAANWSYQHDDNMQDRISELIVRLRNDKYMLTSMVAMMDQILNNPTFNKNELIVKLIKNDGFNTEQIDNWYRRALELKE